MPTSTSPQIDTLTDTLTHLVRLPTVTGNLATNRAALEWIEAELKDTPLIIRRGEHNGVPYLTATTPAVKDPKRPKLWLAAHTDVVPANPRDFVPRIEDNKLYGRGVFDMKYAIAIFITLLKELGDELSHYDLGLMLTCDEETGGHDGAALLADRGYASQAMLLPECGIPWNLESGAKSLSWWQLTSRGQDAHGAYPWLGQHPLDQLLSYIDEMRTHFVKEPCHNPDHPHHNMTVGAIEGGDVYNRVPSVATAKLDLRTMPDVSLEEVTSWFADAALKFPGVTAELAESAPGFTNPSDDATKLFRRLVREETGRELTSKIAHASSDARYFAVHGNQVICVPPTGGGQHSSDEWIDLGDLDKFYEIIRRFVQEWTAV